MSKLPSPSEGVDLVVRTSFEDDESWMHLQQILVQPVGESQFRAYLTFVDDREYASASIHRLLEEAMRAGLDYLFVADHTTFTSPERLVLVLSVSDQPGRSFRVTPTALQVVQNNLSISNMDFDDFEYDLDAEDVLRGFEP